MHAHVNNNIFTKPAQNNLNMTMYGNMMGTKPNKFMNAPGTSMHKQRQKNRVATSLEPKFTNVYMRDVKFNETFRMPVKTVFNNNFMVSNTMKLTPRRMNRRFGGKPY